MTKIKKLSVFATLIASYITWSQGLLALVHKPPLFLSNLPSDHQIINNFINDVPAFPRGLFLVNSKTIEYTQSNDLIVNLAQKLFFNLVKESQESPKLQDKRKFDNIMQNAITRQLYKRSFPEIMQEIAQRFIGTAYQANLLDSSNVETLTVSLNKLDCVLFVETALAIARGVALQNYSYHGFVEHLSDERYRDGRLDGYCSRLHYFSEWIADNQKRGTIQDIAHDLGGVQLHKKLNFMSQHRRSSLQLVSNDDNYQCMLARENKLDGLEINYIPLSKIRNVYEKLQPGDIVAIATSIDGLDVTHTGLIYQTKNGNIGFIHASPSGAVKIAPDLQTYVSRINYGIGILLARPIDPR